MTVEECPTDEAHTEKYNNDEGRATLLSAKYLNILVTISTGKSLQDQLTDMKERNTACAFLRTPFIIP